MCTPDPTQIYLEIDMEMNALALEARLSSNSKTTTLQTSEEPTRVPALSDHLLLMWSSNDKRLVQSRPVASLETT